MKAGKWAVMGFGAVALALLLAAPGTGRATTTPSVTPPPPADAVEPDRQLAQNEQDETRVLVAAVQERLAALGYDPGPVDGKMGPKTRNAIQSFQAERGIAPDGQPTQTLLAALNAALVPAASSEQQEGEQGPTFIADWLLGTWKIDCTGEDQGLIFDRVAYDRTWSEEWAIVLDEPMVRVCRDAGEGKRFCYLYSKISEEALIYLGYESEDRRVARNIRVKKCQ